MTTRTELINLIAEQIDAQSYVEIGVYNPEHNFNHIKVPVKVSVDPDPNAKAVFCGTSDAYFFVMKHLKAKADIFFIDGLHHADQVKKDIENAWECLNVGGVIVLHDCNPHSESITHVPRDSREWCGDVYKVITSLVYDFKYTVDIDYGCCMIIKVNPDCKLQWYHTEGSPNWDVPWGYFDANRNKCLRIISAEDAIHLIKSLEPCLPQI